MKILEEMQHREVSLERAALSKIMTDGYIDPWIRAEYFVGDEKRIFLDLSEMWRMNGDIDLNALQGPLKPIGIEIMESVGSITNTGKKLLIDAFLRRETAKEVITLYSRCESLENVPREIQSAVSNLLINQEQKKYDHVESLSTVIGLINAGCNNNAILGVPIGIDGFDSIVHGFEKKKFYVLGALKKTGKSRFMVYVALRLAESGARVLMNSLEMSDVQLNLLAFSRLSGVDSSTLGNLPLPVAVLPRIATAQDILMRYNWQISRDYTVADLRARIIGMKNASGCDYVFVDFIQRMRDDTYGRDRVREVERISMDLADLSRDCDVGIIALAQLAGHAEKLPPDEIPSMASLKESQGIAENADCIIMLHHPDRNEVATDGSAKKHFRAKIDQRYGLSGAVAEIDAYLGTCNFTDATEKYEPRDRKTEKNWPGKSAI